MIKSYKIRLLPAKEQEELMLEHANAARFIWNWALDYQIRWYEIGERHLSEYDMMRNVRSLKQREGYAWLKNVSNNMLSAIMIDLDKAYDGFFKQGKGFPKFKSKKKSIPRFPVRSERMYFVENFVKIEKVGKVNFQTNYIIPKTKYINPRIGFVNGKWILTFSVEYENQVRNLTENKMGIDLGVKDLAVVAYGNEQFVFHNINKSKKMKKLESKLKHLQRNVSRKYQTNGNYEKSNDIIKLEAQIKKVYYHISCIRKNYLHQTTHKLIELLPKRVVMEDLNISGLMKNKHLSKAIGEQCLSEFIRQMKYKCEWNGIEFIQASRFYPSSKACSNCGQIKKDLKLKDRVYKCDCGLIIDRDYNAALNLMRYEV